MGVATMTANVNIPVFSAGDVVAPSHSIRVQQASLYYNKGLLPSSRNFFGHSFHTPLFSIRGYTSRPMGNYVLCGEIHNLDYRVFVFYRFQKYMEMK